MSPSTTSPAVLRALLALAAALALVGCAGADQVAEPTGQEDRRVVEVRMVDTAFEPSTIEVADGETVRLRFTNDGALPHDAFIGDADAQAAHGEEMAEAADGGHGGHGDDDAGAVTVEPGETAELVHTFTAGEDVVVGCHQPGHYDAGMVLDVQIT